MPPTAGNKQDLTRIEQYLPYLSFGKKGKLLVIAVSDVYLAELGAVIKLCTGIQIGRLISRDEGDRLLP